MKPAPLPDQEVLNAMLDYDQHSGLVVWKQHSQSYLVGRRAGCERGHSKSADYRWRVVRVAGVLYAEHRVVWKMATGQEPEQIDHLNGDATDNRLCNLRAATASQNRSNSVARGEWPKGVCFDRERQLFMAKIKRDGRTVFLGRYATPEQAAAAYERAAVAAFGAFASVRSRAK